MTDFTIKTVTPVLNWSARGSKMSWQQIMSSYSKKHLTGVNGDEPSPPGRSCIGP